MSCARNVSKHSNITQDWMGEMFSSSLELVINIVQVPQLAISPHTLPSFYIPHIKKAKFCLCYLKTSMQSQDLPILHFSKDSGNFCVQVLEMQTEINQKKTPPSLNMCGQGHETDDQQLQKEWILYRLCKSVLTSRQLS